MRFAYRVLCIVLDGRVAGRRECGAGHGGAHAGAAGKDIPELPSSQGASRSQAALGERHLCRKVRFLDSLFDVLETD